jgi:NADH-quinone oxidoreductase subunit G
MEAEFVVSITPFASPELRAVADVILPIGSFAETSGTYVNLEGRWQSQTGAALPVGESRPGWKVLRVLGNLLELPGFDHQSSEDVLAELKGLTGEPAMAAYQGGHKAALPMAGASLVDLPMYQIDALVRRAPALARTREGRTQAVTY